MRRRTRRTSYVLPGQWLRLLFKFYVTPLFKVTVAARRPLKWALGYNDDTSLTAYYRSASGCTGLIFSLLHLLLLLCLSSSACTQARIKGPGVAACHAIISRTPPQHDGPLERVLHAQRAANLPQRVPKNQRLSHASFDVSRWPL